MMIRRLILTLCCAVVSIGANCEIPQPPTPPTPEEQARTAAEQQFRDHVDAKHYLMAAEYAVSERLFDDPRRAEEVTKLLSAYAGELEASSAPDRLVGFAKTARLAKRAGLPDSMLQSHATAAFHAGVALNDAESLAKAALIAKEFDVVLDDRWRAAAQVWVLTIEGGAPSEKVVPAFVNQFPLSGGLADVAFSAAMELGRWRAARMIAERAQLPEEKFRAARTKEIEELLAQAIHDRNDQRILDLSLEAPSYVDATVLRTVAARVVTKLLEEQRPGDAYALAIAHNLDGDHAKHAADAFFAAAIKKRAYSLARQMPDGTFIIVNLPPAPPPATPTKAAPAPGR
ncbi:MAG: hypothetical protein Q7S02_00285 [bacterium]|nr:hypothetical protein [bacterium]